MARSAAILRSAVYNAMHNEPMSPKSTSRPDEIIAAMGMHPPSFPFSPLLQMNETKGTVRGSKSSVICLARLLRDAFIERIECLREREKDSGDSGANSGPFERMTINEATV